MASRKCPFCGQYNKFGEVDTYLHKYINRQFCSHDHFIEWAVENKKKLASKTKIERKSEDNKKRKEVVQDKKWWTHKTQAKFNEMVRLRDARNPCISCGATQSPQWDAGHFRSQGGFPELRFHSWNCHKQCVRCNRHLRGNLVQYETALRGKIGDMKVNWLKKQQPAKNYTIENLKTLFKYFEKEVKRLKK